MKLINTAEAAERYDMTRRWASMQAKKYAESITPLGKLGLYKDQLVGISLF